VCPQKVRTRYEGDGEGDGEDGDVSDLEAVVDDMKGEL